MGPHGHTATAQRPRTPNQIIAHFDGWELDAGQRWYLPFNVRRLALLLAKVDELVAREAGGEPRLLDIGAGFQTELLRTGLPGATVDTLGFPHPLFPPRPGEEHHWFDLNDSVERERWPDTGGYKLAVLAEVIEHLHTSPDTVLRCLRSLLAPSGYLIVQTPNAVALHKRLQMLVGRHPYGPLSDSRTNPMHFREYTAGEIAAAGAEAGLSLDGLSLHSYFDRGTPAARAYNALGRVLPPRLRTGITAVFRNDA